MQLYYFTFVHYSASIGDRGLLREIYGYNNNVNAFREFARANPGNSQSNVEFTEASAGNNYFNSKYSGFFVPPFSGSYTFYIRSDDSSRFYLSSNMSAEHTRLIAYVHGYTYAWNRFSSQISRPVELVGGKPYYLEVLHFQAQGTWILGFGAKYHNTEVTSDTVYGDREQQQIHISVEIKKETHVRLQNDYV